MNKATTDEWKNSDLFIDLSRVIILYGAEICEHYRQGNHVKFMQSDDGGSVNWVKSENNACAPCVWVCVIWFEVCGRSHCSIDVALGLIGAVMLNKAAVCSARTNPIDRYVSMERIPI